jgi:hypothetical protein
MHLAELAKQCAELRASVRGVGRFNQRSAQKRCSLFQPPGLAQGRGLGQELTQHAICSRQRFHA